MDRYADVILPVPLNQLFTYLIPEPLQNSVKEGSRVYVPFGKGRRLTGITVRTHGVRPDAHTVKEIMGVLDQDGPSVLPPQLKLMEWMADYCMCSPGDVMKAALPPVYVPTAARMTSRTSPGWRYSSNRDQKCLFRRP